MRVIKRDGRSVKFNDEKIINAIKAAFNDVDGEVSSQAEDIAKAAAIIVTNNLVNRGKKSYEVEEIQDLVEEALMQTARKDVAKAYILYRNERTRLRNNNSALTKMVGEKVSATNVENQNANVDERSFGGRKGEAADVIMKQYALDHDMSPLARDRHNNNEIYTHDLNSFSLGEHNCLSIPFDPLLANGFTTRQTDIRSANSVGTALQLVAVIIQLQSLQQFGGVSATHLDWTLVPYVRKSFVKHFKDGWYYVESNMLGTKETSDAVINTWDDDITNLSIEDSKFKLFPKAYRYAMDMLQKEIHQGVEGLYHNLNTLQSRSGNQLN